MNQAIIIVFINDIPIPLLPNWIDQLLCALHQEYLGDIFAYISIPKIRYTTKHIILINDINIEIRPLTV